MRKLPLVAVCAVAACSETSAPETAMQSAATAEFDARLNALSSQVDAAEAVRSVKRLQWAYGHYSEFGLWHDFADLFADTGVGHYVQGDLDREGIRALFLEQVGQGQLGLADGRIYPHISFSPVVDLSADGTQALGRFRILAMLGAYGGNATWFHGVYENAYVKEDGVWKLNETSNAAQITGNFTAGLAPSATPPSFPLHFTSETVGALPSAREDSGADLASLQQRLARLEDEAAITSLQHNFGYLFDAHEWDTVVNLFAEQGTFEYGLQGVYTGKASIREALNGFGTDPAPAGEVDSHVLFQTYVSVAPDGMTAKARVDQLGLQGKAGGTAEWTQGIYENTFVKENGEWRIQALHYYPRLVTDYARGWASDAQPAPGPSTENPPDAPPTESYGVFPDFHIPAFHFPHPVTGRAPQYPEGDPASGRAVGFAMPETTLPQQPANETNLAAAEALAQRVLAVDAIENLVTAYGYYLDECLVQDAAALFEADGTTRIPGIGFYTGREKIARALELAYCPAGREEGAATLHHIVQPAIYLSEDGQTATVITRLWQVHATEAGDDYYLMGHVLGIAARQGEQWKLRTLGTRYEWVASVEEGWARATTNAALGYAAPASMLTEFPPDTEDRTTPRLAPYP